MVREIAHHIIGDMPIAPLTLESRVVGDFLVSCKACVYKTQSVKFGKSSYYLL
jgi:hypothetical protein